MNSKKLPGLIAVIASLAIVIGISMYFYNKYSNTTTENQKDILSEMEENKKNAENSASTPEDGNTTPENTGNGSENSDDASESTDAPILAPDFRVYDNDGNIIYLSDKKGKPVLINFWATWCGPCQKEMPYFQEAYKKYGDKIEFMMINPADGLNDTNENVDNFLLETGYTFPVYRDIDIDAAQKYGIRSFPTTLLVNEDGYFIGGYEGAMSEEMLNAVIELLLS